MQVFSNPCCEAFQYAMDLLFCPFLKTNQFVVQFQSFQRLEKQGRATGTGSVHDSRQFFAIFYPNRNHKPFVPDCNNLILNRLRGAVPLQDPPQTLVQSVSQDTDFITDAFEQRAGMVIHFAVRGNLASEGRNQSAYFRKGSRNVGGKRSLLDASTQ